MNSKRSIDYMTFRVSRFFYFPINNIEFKLSHIYIICNLMAKSVRNINNDYINIIDSGVLMDFQQSQLSVSIWFFFFDMYSFVFPDCTMICIFRCNAIVMLTIHRSLAGRISWLLKRGSFVAVAKPGNLIYSRHCGCTRIYKLL